MARLLIMMGWILFSVTAAWADAPAPDTTAPAPATQQIPATASPAAKPNNTGSKSTASATIGGAAKNTSGISGTAILRAKHRGQ